MRQNASTNSTEPLPLYEPPRLCLRATYPTMKQGLKYTLLAELFRHSAHSGTFRITVYKNRKRDYITGCSGSGRLGGLPSTLSTLSIAVTLTITSHSLGSLFCMNEPFHPGAFEPLLSRPLSFAS